MKFISLSLLIMISMNVFAEVICEEDPNVGGGGGSAEKFVKFVEGQECPNKAKLKNFCMIVGNHMKNNTGEGKYPFLFQKRFLEAACVKDSDSDELRTEKLRRAWKMGEDNYLACTGSDFEVLKGNIIKYAVAAKFNEFIDEAIKWKVDLNKIDDSDKRTVLDYVKYHLDKNKGNELEIVYQMYYMKLKKAGAKHSSEI